MRRIDQERVAVIEFWADLFEGDLYTDLCGLSPVLTEHSASNAENFVLNLEGLKKLHYYALEAL